MRKMCGFGFQTRIEAGLAPPSFRFRCRANSRQGYLSRQGAQLEAGSRACHGVVRRTEPDPLPRPTRLGGPIATWGGKS